MRPGLVRPLRRLGAVLAVLAAHGLLLAWLADAGGQAPPAAMETVAGTAPRAVEVRALGPALAAEQAPALAATAVPAEAQAATRLGPPRESPPAPRPEPLQPALQPRALAADLSAVPVASAAAPAPSAAASEVAFELRDEPPLRLAAASVPEAAPLPATTEAGSAPAPAQEAGRDAAGSPAAAAQAPSGAAPVETVPVYPTRLPPAFTLGYELRRGSLGGTGELSWQPGAQPGARYVLRLEGRVPILGSVITQTSQGLVDAHGLAPLRFTDRRLRRGEQAANFQREAGRITFSGPSTSYALVPGAQDRLSWMVQLAAIGEAAPERVRSGRITLFVVSARGDADVWHFRRVGEGTLRVGGQALQTVQLLREPRQPHDTRVEVWLAPDAHHLPVRARMTDSGGEAFELMLNALPPQLRQ